MLIDCVKKDDLSAVSVLATGGASSPSHAMQATPVFLAANLDITTFNGSGGGGGSNAESKRETLATHASAAVGQFLLSFLFYQSTSTSSASHYTSIGGLSSSTLSDAGGTALCHSILRTCFDKFCGMAPNALEHALLLKDLLQFSPLSLEHLMKDQSVNGCYNKWN